MDVIVSSRQKVRKCFLPAARNELATLLIRCAENLEADPV
jgi:hypothetical protein